MFRHSPRHASDVFGYCGGQSGRRHGVTSCAGRKSWPRVRRGPIDQTGWMQIPDDHVDEFIRSWEIAFNERLSRDDARTKAAELLELFSLLANRPPGEGLSTPLGEGERLRDS